MEKLCLPLQGIVIYFSREKGGKSSILPCKNEFTTSQKRQNCSYRWDSSRESKNHFFIVFVR